MKTVEMDYPKFKALDNRDLLIDMQEDQSLYSLLKDRLRGKDEETDELLEEIQKLQLETIEMLAKEIING